MSGETRARISGWTVDTLHSHMQEIGEEREKGIAQRFTDQEKLLSALAVERAALLAVQHNERDLRYNQRFDASEKALAAAFAAQQVALAAQQKTVEAALTAAKEAVDKAASANDLRFNALAEKIDGAVGLLTAGQARTAEGDRRQSVALQWPGIVAGLVGVAVAAIALLVR